MQREHDKDMSLFLLFLWTEASFPAQGFPIISVHVSDHAARTWPNEADLRGSYPLMGPRLVVHSRLAQCCSGGLHKSVAMKKKFARGGSECDTSTNGIAVCHDC